MDPESHGLRIERVFAAPPERIYAAITEPDLRNRWLKPADEFRVAATELDARVGGAYRDAFVAPDGTRFEESGRFLALEPPHRIAYTCRFEGGGVLEPDMRVEIALAAAGAEKTRLVLTQTGYRERKNRDEQEQGWPAFLDQLAKLLAKR